MFIKKAIVKIAAYKWKDVSPRSFHWEYRYNNYNN